MSEKSTRGKKFKISIDYPEIENEDDLEKLKADADKSDPDAMYKYGLILFKGDKVRRNIIKASYLIKSAADKGNTDAMLAYANMLNYEYETTKKESYCLTLKRAADDGDIKAMQYLGCLLTIDDGDPYDEEYGIKFIKLAADNGNDEAMVDYADRLREGRGVTVDKKEAARLYKLAADKGNGKAMYNYAKMLEEGDGIPADKEESNRYDIMSIEAAKKVPRNASEEGRTIKPKKIIRKRKTIDSESEKSDSEENKPRKSKLIDSDSKERIPNKKKKENKSEDSDTESSDSEERISQRVDIDYESSDDPDAMYKYGMILLKGDKVKRNIIKASYFIKSAAEKGNKDALVTYGSLLNGGFNTTKFEKTCLLIKEAADNGDFKAMYLLGGYLVNEDNDPYDPEFGMKLMKSAAENGNEEALVDYANRLREGKGVPVDKKEAARFYKIAADKGNGKAMFYYAKMLEEGDGIPANEEESMKYYLMAKKIADQMGKDKSEENNSEKSSNKSKKSNSDDEKSDSKEERIKKHMKKSSIKNSIDSNKRKSVDSDSDEEKTRKISDVDSDSDRIISRRKKMKKSLNKKMTESNSEEIRSEGKSRKNKKEGSDFEEKRPKEMRRKGKVHESDYENSNSDDKKSRKLSDTDSDSDNIAFRKKAQKTTKRAENKPNKMEENYFIGIKEEKNYKMVKTIAESETSTVYKLIDKTTLKPICKKVLKVEGTTFNDFRNALKEFQILYYLKHPSICAAIGLNTSDIVKNKTDKEDEITTVSLYLEFIDYTLKDIITNSIINNTLKTRFIIEIVHGMKYIHSKGMIYRDLNIESIMINAAFHVKLIDFGLAKINEKLFGEELITSYSLTKGVGMDDFMSPEMMMQEDYNNKTDVYSFGIIIYYIFVGRIPKQNVTEKSKGKKIKLPKESESISKNSIDLISRCLSFDPKDRPSFEEILNYLRDKKYILASDVDPSIISIRDSELESFDKIDN